MPFGQKATCVDTNALAERVERSEGRGDGHLRQRLRGLAFVDSRQTADHRLMSAGLRQRERPPHSCWFSGIGNLPRRAVAPAGSRLPNEDRFYTLASYLSCPTLR